MTTQHSTAQDSITVVHMPPRAYGLTDLTALRLISLLPCWETYQEYFAQQRMEALAMKRRGEAR